MQKQVMKISEIKINPNNPRIIKDDKFRKLVESVKSFPEMLELRPIVVNKDVIILGGNMRYKACKEAGLKEIPVIVADNLTEEQEREFLIKDNVSGGEWDWDILANEWDKEELEEWGLDVQFETVEPEAEEDDFEVDEGIQTDIVLGDLFEIGPHRLLCGDSTNIDDVNKLMNGEKADMVFTDPPYGVDYDGGHATEKRREKLKNDDKTDMYGLPLVNAYIASNEKAPLYLWFADRFAKDVLDGLYNAGYEIRNWIIWNKNLAQFGAIGAQYKSKHEPCIYAYKKGKSPIWEGPNNEVTVWDISRESKNEYHLTQKPIALIDRAILNHKPKSVLDLFGGSGSSMVGAYKRGIKNYTMELDPKYVQTIINRMIKLDSTLEIKRNGVHYKPVISE